jgi:xylem cysteine proteinase
MKITFTLLCFICSITTAVADVKHLSANSSADVFEKWITKHSKQYQNLEEKQRRYEIFKANLKHIEETNKQRKSYRLGLNVFADMHHEEFRSKYLGLKHNLSKKREAALGDSTSENAGYLPKFVDWRKKGAVTQVKNQGTCGKLFDFVSIFC